jgi:hypothetical protein
MSDYLPVLERIAAALEKQSGISRVSLDGFHDGAAKQDIDYIYVNGVKCPGYCWYRNSAGKDEKFQAQPIESRYFSGTIKGFRYRYTEATDKIKESHKLSTYCTSAGRTYVLEITCNSSTGRGYLTALKSLGGNVLVDVTFEPKKGDDEQVVFMNLYKGSPEYDNLIKGGSWLSGDDAIAFAQFLHNAFPAGKREDDQPQATDAIAAPPRPTVPAPAPKPSAPAKPARPGQVISTEQLSYLMDVAAENGWTEAQQKDLLTPMGFATRAQITSEKFDHVIELLEKGPDVLIPF